MSKKTTVYLARHGQTEWNTVHRIQGQLDSALTKTGKTQALQLATLCRPFNITHILTSPLGRAVQTASICAKQLHVEMRSIEGLKERHFGTWQGLLTPDMRTHKDYLEITSQVTDCKPENGESALQLVTRFQEALREQLKTQPEATFLVITHADVLRCFMSQFSSHGAPRTGYEYKNCHFISIGYDYYDDSFFTL